MKPIIDHIQITVRDVAVAVPFYAQLLPLLGFARESRSSAVIEKHDFFVVEYSHPLLSFAITSPRTALFRARRFIDAGPVHFTILRFERNHARRSIGFMKRSKPLALSS